MPIIVSEYSGSLKSFGLREVSTGVGMTTFGLSQSEVERNNGGDHGLQSDYMRIAYFEMSRRSGIPCTRMTKPIIRIYGFIICILWPYTMDGEHGIVDRREVLRAGHTAVTTGTAWPL
ncbi:hypothetical protein V6N13_133403 [Hibiscus sabdariffa]